MFNIPIKEHLTTYDILPETQSGFPVGYSCTTMLMNVTDNILNDIDNGNS